MCEKPLGVNKGEVRAMYEAVRDAGVVHMTAFTYRFAPSMKYLRHLLKSGALGTPRHFRSQRFLDWPETSWGWRQYKDKAGAGDLYDMTIHRIDFALDLLGPLERVCGAVARFAPRDVTPDGKPCPPSEVDDWSSLIGEFQSRRRRRLGGDDAGQGLPPRRLRPRVGRDQRLRRARPSTGSTSRTRSCWARPARTSPRSPSPPSSSSPRAAPATRSQGKPATVFRYDLVWEFVSAIVEGRPAVPSFYDGLNAQIIADAVLESHAKRAWVDTPLAEV